MITTLRDLQLCELDILRLVKSVCDKHQIRYYLSSGTLLGAVRHQGFIPWDDDIDIEMPYADYLRFLEIAPSEFGDACFLQNGDTDPYFHFAYSRVRKNDTTMMREWETTIPSHHGVWIDVFPMAYVGGKLDYHLKRLLLKIRTFLRMHEDVFSLNRKWLTEQSSVPMMLLVRAARAIPQKTRYKLCGAIERFIFRDREKAFLSTVWTEITCRIPAGTFEPPAELPFEDSIFTVPRDYDTYLRVTYGDYMKPPPEDQRGTRHGELLVDLEHAWQPGEALPITLGEESAQ